MQSSSFAPTGYLYLSPVSEEILSEGAFVRALEFLNFPTYGKTSGLVKAQMQDVLR